MYFISDSRGTKNWRNVRTICLILTKDFLIFRQRLRINNLRFTVAIDNLPKLHRASFRAMNPIPERKTFEPHRVLEVKVIERERLRICLYTSREATRP